MEIRGSINPMEGIALRKRKKSRADRLSETARNFDIDIVYAFGSHAREALKWLMDEQFGFSISPPSDLDIGVKPTGNKTLSVKDKVRLAMALEDLFCVSRVDLVNLNETDPFVTANVIRGERLHAKNADPADEYDLYVLRRAGDLIPLVRCSKDGGHHKEVDQ
ncbi:conserved hypothetical protein [delta proteobacterium NaphS2]|nr:conserved hypothetical protein [delta proteobacterium NaphS2]